MSKSRISIIIIGIMIAAVMPGRVMAQLDAQLTQYYEIPAYYNPAAIGLTDKLAIRGGTRMQWVGIKRAPQAFMLNANMPLKLFGQRFGVGISASSESEGLFSRLSVGAQLGYKLKLFKGELTASVQIGFGNEVFKGSKVKIPTGDDYHEDNDDAIPKMDMAGNALDLGVGVFYTHKYFWAGVSCQHVNSPTVTFSDENNSTGGMSGSGSTNQKNYEFQINRTIYFMAGSNIQIKNTLFEVMPSVFVKSDFNFWRAEATGRVRWKKFLTAGIGYRYDDAVMAILGVEFKGFYVGYSYDYPLSAISKASSGSHEIVAGYNLKLNFSDKNKNKHKSIRIM